MDNFVFDILKPEYVKGIAEIEKLCFSSPWSENQIREELENPLFVCVVALQKGMVIGYGGYLDIAGDAQITNIAVHPDFQGNKLGDEILTHIISSAKDRNDEQITLEVRKSNLRAINLYKKHGFIIVGERKKYYEGKEDAILMTKSDI